LTTLSPLKRNVTSEIETLITDELIVELVELESIKEFEDELLQAEREISPKSK
jgi:hypothetical protein